MTNTGASNVLKPSPTRSQSTTNGSEDFVARRVAVGMTSKSDSEFQRVYDMRTHGNRGEFRDARRRAEEARDVHRDCAARLYEYIGR